MRKSIEIKTECTLLLLLSAPMPEGVKSIEQYVIKPMTMNKKNRENGKILLASLAGLSAGIIAGLLLAPEDGRASRQSVMQSLTEAGDEVNQTLKRWTGRLKAMSSGQEQQGNDDDELVLHGSWDDVKGQMRNNYDEITDDLDNQAGK